MGTLPRMFNFRLVVDFEFPMCVGNFLGCMSATLDCCFDYEYAWARFLRMKNVQFFMSRATRHHHARPRAVYICSVGFDSFNGFFSPKALRVVWAWVMVLLCVFVSQLGCKQYSRCTEAQFPSSVPPLRLAPDKAGVGHNITPHAAE